MTTPPAHDCTPEEFNALMDEFYRAIALGHAKVERIIRVHLANWHPRVAGATIRILRRLRTDPSPLRYG